MSYKKAAEILVECGYCDGIDYEDGTTAHAYRMSDGEIDFTFNQLDPFADTLEGRRQLDTIVDYLQINHDLLWVQSWPIFAAVTSNISAFLAGITRLILRIQSFSVAWQLA